MSSPAAHSQVFTSLPTVHLLQAGFARYSATLVSLVIDFTQTVAQRLDALIAHGYIAPAATESSTGGRPAGAFQINANAGVMLLASIGAGAIGAATVALDSTTVNVPAP